MSLRLVDFLNFLFGQLQFAAGDTEGQHELLLGGFSLGTFSLEVAVMHAADDQADRDSCEGGPANQRLREEVEPVSVFGAWD